MHVSSQGESEYTRFGEWVSGFGNRFEIEFLINCISMVHTRSTVLAHVQ